MTTINQAGTGVTPDRKRTEYVKGLRVLANLLADFNGIRLPMDGRLLPIALSLEAETALADAVAARSHMTDPATAIGGDGKLTIVGRIHGLRVEVSLRTADVCEKRVTGIHKASDGSVHEIVEWAIPAELRDAEDGAL